MNAARHYIAIDLGAESGRVMLGTLADGAITLAEVHRFPNGPVPVAHDHGITLHWDILRLWQEITAGIAKITAEHQVSGIAVDTWGVDFALLDAAGRLLENPIHYRDARTDGMIQQVFSQLSREKIYAITGIQTMALNTLFQLASIAQNRPHLLERAAAILFIPDLINYFLCGRKANEYTIASTSQMLDARRRGWSPDVLAAAGIKPEMFPEKIIHPGTTNSILGTVQPTVGNALRATGIPVIAIGSHDTASAVAAVPAAGNDWLYLSSGTWSLLGAEVAQPVLSEKAAAYNLTNEGGLGNTIRLLKNIAGLWLLQECRRDWARAGENYDYPALARLAQSAPSGTAILNPDDPLFAQPGDMPAKVAQYCRNTNQPIPRLAGEFARVILESLATTYAKVIHMIQDVTGQTYRKLHIVGGGSQNILLNQLAANATGLTVYAGPVEATALGNVLAQALATGDIKSLAQGRQMIANSMQLTQYQPQR